MTYDEFLINIGKNIRMLRQKKHLTQEVVAEQLNISVKHFSAIERGETSTSFQVLFDLSQLFQVPPDLFLQDPMEPAGIHHILSKFSYSVDTALMDLYRELERAGSFNIHREN